MAFLETLVYGSAAALFAVFVGLSWSARRRRWSGYAELADHEGWNLERHVHGPETAPKGYWAHHMDADLYLAGPSRAGPFRLFAHEDAGGRGGVLVHLRTAGASPGLDVAPTKAFLRHSDPEKADGIRLDHNGFLHRFRVAAKDHAFAADALDHAACDLLLRPGQPVRFSWRAHDLWVAFPVPPRDPAATRRLVTYAEALGTRLQAARRGPHHRVAVSRPDLAVQGEAAA